MNTDKLATMLNAKRPDLIDGFACKAAMRALNSEGDKQSKLDYLNGMLKKKRISLIMVTKHEEMLDGFKEAGLAGGATYVDGSIEIKITPTFFNQDSKPTVVKRALRFQSLVTHELVHREQFQHKPAYGKTHRTDEEKTNTEYLNDELEIEAMAAEISHDMRVKHLVGGSQMLEISPRLKNLTENARLIGAETIATLQASMKAYA